MPARTPPQPDDTTTTDAPAMLYEWRACDQHEWIAPSVIVTRGAPPWCIGLADEIRGHPVEIGAAP